MFENEITYLTKSEMKCKKSLIQKKNIRYNDPLHEQGAFLNMYF